MSDADAQIRKILRPVRGCATDDQFTETYERVDTALRKARVDALEEAAKVCQQAWNATLNMAAFNALKQCVAAIRALKDKP